MCRAWASAAASATVQRTLTATARAFQAWLLQHAGQLRTLQLSSGSDGAARPSLVLPLVELQQLQRLELQRLSVQLQGKDGCEVGQQLGSLSLNDSSQATEGLPLRSLQHLQLSHVELWDTSSLLQLTHAPQLTSLVTDCLGFPRLGFSGYHVISTPPATVQRVAAAFPAILQQLPRLSVLELPGLPVTDAALQHVTAMPGLQQVSLSRVGDAAECDLRHLPPSITQLCFQRGRSLPAQLQQLTGLVHLELDSCDLPPTLLGSVTQLQALNLHCCRLLPSNPGLLFDGDNTQALLGGLRMLARLQVLSVVLSGASAYSGAYPSPCFDALTAHSRLTQLVVGCAYGGCTLPRSAVWEMFPEHRQHPQLQGLEISAAACDNGCDYDALHWVLCNVDLECIGSCCPGLRRLDITSTVWPVDADLSGLLQLPSSCTSLSVGGAALTDSTAATLAQLTQLQDLSWKRSRQLTVTGLEQLTALELNRLRADCRVHSSWTQVELSCDQHKGTVSQQLAALCGQEECVVQA